ncbi:MAG: glutathione synthase [Micavibrio sp.]|nr:glutathione synthase [Micavibrio sp.]
MSLNVAIQMDDPRGINITKDTTFVLGLEAQRRGHKLSYYSADSMTLMNGSLCAQSADMTLREKMADHVVLSGFEARSLDSYDLILMRQDYNNPQSYTALTHMLDHVRGKVLVLNDPDGVRNSPEKMLITHFPDLAPPTLLTREISQVRDFHEKYGEIIIKPMNGFGGLDIYHLREGDGNLQAVLEMMGRLHPEPFVVQKYLPEIRTQGDKRIIVIEGEPIGAFTRLPQVGSARANLHAGGRAEKSEITDRDREVCSRLKPELVKRGLVLVGLDMIGDYVTEINPKSPTGMQNIYHLSGIKCEEAAWDAFERRYEEFRRNT